jgi:SMC interacting uncharacterized protein involved in chromosome segregation
MNQSNKFDTLPPFVQVVVLASLVLTVPLWGIPYFVHLLITDTERSRKKDEHLNKIVRDAMTLQANQEYLRDHFRKVRADVAYRERIESQRKENENDG